MDLLISFILFYCVYLERSSDICIYFTTQAFPTVFNGRSADGDLHIIHCRCVKVLGSRTYRHQLPKVFIMHSHRRGVYKTFSQPRRFWWRNLLYINNLFSHDELCMNWTWSMACEMQFFLAFTFILFIYAK